MKIGNSWDSVLDMEYAKSMTDWVKSKRDEGVHVLPDDEDIFRAFKLTPFDAVKVVILGQDPYPGKSKDGNYQAMGLSFASRSTVDVPASLKNVYKELYEEYGFYNICPDLTKWAEQGVLLLNTVLTVQADCANSHRDMGWERLTSMAVKALGHSDSSMVFMLWGNQAHSFDMYIRKDNGSKLVLKAAHPSPLSANRGFLGCGHFTLANEFLVSKELPPIDWRV